MFNFFRVVYIYPRDYKSMVSPSSKFHFWWSYLKIFVKTKIKICYSIFYPERFFNGAITGKCDTLCTRLFLYTWLVSEWFSLFVVDRRGFSNPCGFPTSVVCMQTAGRHVATAYSSPRVRLSASAFDVCETCSWPPQHTRVQGPSHLSPKIHWRKFREIIFHWKSRDDSRSIK